MKISSKCNPCRNHEQSQANSDDPIYPIPRRYQSTIMRAEIIETRAEECLRRILVLVMQHIPRQ